MAKRDWSNIDWSKRNKDIAEELGVPPVNVSQARKRWAPKTVRPVHLDRTMACFKLRTELYEKLKAFARVRRVSMTALIELLIEEGLPDPGPGELVATNHEMEEG